MNPKFHKGCANTGYLKVSGAAERITHDASNYTHNVVLCWSSPHQSLIPPRINRWSPFHMKVEVDSWSSPHSLLTLSTLTVDPLYIDCQSSLHWLLTLSTLYIDCWPCLHWLLILSTLTVDPLYTVHWLLILSTLTVDPLYTVHWLLTLSTLTVDPLYIDCWSSLHWLLIHPPPTGSTEAITFSHESESLVLILSASIVNLPPPGSTVLVTSVVLIIDPPWVDCQSTPLQISTFKSLIYWFVVHVWWLAFLDHMAKTSA